MLRLFRKMADAHDRFTLDTGIAFFQKFIPKFLRNQYRAEEVRQSRIVYEGHCMANMSAVFTYRDARHECDIRVTFAKGRVIAERV